MGLCKPKVSQNVESTKMLLLHNTRDAGTIAQQADTELVHNLLGKNAMISIPSMLYVWYLGDMIQDDQVWQS